MRIRFIFIALLYFLSQTIAMAQPVPNYIQVSQNLLYAAKTGDSTESFTRLLAAAGEQELSDQLNTNDRKMAFWLNIYNAFTQISLKNNPDRYKKRSAFFREKLMVIAGRSLNLDQVEHGLLRKSQVKWGLGYIGKCFPSRFEKKFRVTERNWRIHFALNCGAKSCPPIAFYKPEQLYTQLQLSTLNYLKSECVYDSGANRIGVPALMSWFRGDFGGKENILPLLKTFRIIPDNRHPKIYFRKYNWRLYLDNYKTEEE